MKVLDILNFFYFIELVLRIKFPARRCFKAVDH